MHPFLAELPDLAAELDRLLAQIPRGRVTSYGDIAESLGDIKAARWVAEALLTADGHKHSAQCSCHRVIRRTGELGGFITDGLEKSELLRKEGIVVRDGKVDSSRHWEDFECEAPLSRLIEVQHTIAESVRPTEMQQLPELVAGVDAAFVGRRIVATCVAMSFPKLETVAEWTHVSEVRFPYIPGYLSFRELPALWELWEQIEGLQRPDLLVVDGNGRLHPRRAGIASCFGVMTGTPTIGIGKSLLCGRVDASEEDESDAHDTMTFQTVMDGKEWLADCIQPRPHSKPIYASIGNLIDKQALRAILPKLFRGHRLPEPVYQADRLSKVSAGPMRHRASRSSH